MIIITTSCGQELFLARNSPIHGQGLFARWAIPVAARVTEYTGERITKQESLERCQAGNDYIFALDDEFDLDGSSEQNPARWINHSCEPNCETRLIDGRVWVVALRNI